MNGSEQWRDAWGARQCPSEWGLAPGEAALRFVVHGVLLTTVGCLGLAGNALAALVLTRRAMRSSAACLLLGLAAADAALLLCSLLLFGLPAWYPYSGLLRRYYAVVCPRLTPALYPLACAAQTMSVYLTLLLTVERWVAVCRPLSARALCTEARARLLVLGAALFALAYNAPKFFEAEVYRLEEEGTEDEEEEEVYCVRATALRSPLYVALYVHWAYLVVMYVVPFTALAVLNARIVLQVRRAQRERARLSRGQRRELGLATMLLAVVLVFFLCNLLPLVTNAFEVFRGDAFEHLDALVKTGNLLVTINSSVNFLIYVTLGERFKRVFLKMCRCGGGGRGLAERLSLGRTGGRAGTSRRTAGGTLRDSPEHTRDDSFASCEQMSLRAASLRGRGARPRARPPPRCPPAPPTDVTAATEDLQLDALPSHNNSCSTRSSRLTDC